ncbi:hypothetical protein C8D88_101638 [Lentzea atacamensis]|uniref:Uncharacterized protein n=1 Tax=Lentzea atacamensis TaxID=531938 RepID=A0A316ID52_9PSEU|nr:hypothetical protein [Lentzea atacamensis]PWK90620.1 hypothetical protein C8D88_101638 [Lentzea atacamensis]
MSSKPGRVACWSLSVPDIEEVCHRYNQPWEFDPDHRESLFPLSNPCNPSYDLVPPYVNPMFFALLASTVVFTVIAVVQRVRREKT